MMAGNIRWNIAIGLCGMSMTFMFTFSNNVFSTTILRSLYSFIILFAMTYVFRWMMGAIAENKGLPDGKADEGHSREEEPHKGNHVDISTPNEENSLQALLKQNLQSSDEDAQFTALHPVKLVTKDKLNPEELTQALRHLSED